tara:strand:+ start:26 stop:202 length:177 start_codon:yes stop_codon:yes gene_type:complete
MKMQSQSQNQQDIKILPQHLLEEWSNENEEMDVTTSSSLLLRQLTQAGGARLFGDIND